MLDAYSAKYQERLQSSAKSNQVVLSFASLSLVSNATKEQVKRFLTDIFTALIDVSRKTGKEARLSLRGFGTLYLFKNRELAFNPVDESINLAQLDAFKANTSNDLFAER